MAEVEISEEARADLEEIRDTGVARFGEEVAEQHLHSIGQSFALLSEHPFAGQERPEFRHSIRAIPRRPHRILYTVQGDVVLIVRVIHHARDIDAALRGEQ